MKRFCWFVTAVVIILYTSLALSQEENMLINSGILGDHERPIVNFPHEAHADLIGCIRCHHDFDEFGENTGSEGQKCSDCHMLNDKENPVPLVRAFHLQCKGCHEILAKAGTYEPPLICAKCHIR